MEKVTLVLDATGEGTIDLRDDPADVADYVAGVVGPLVEALQAIYSPATLAVVLDIAAKTASYLAADEAPNAAAASMLKGIITEQRERLRKVGKNCSRPLTAEMLW